MSCVAYLQLLFSTFFITTIFSPYHLPKLLFDGIYFAILVLLYIKQGDQLVLKTVLGKVLLPSIFIILAYGFWVSPDFKEISAGIAIFLFGMLSLEEGFRAFTGGILEKILKRTTNRLWKSLSFGVLTTTIMQSSSLVSVIAISFLGAGLIGLAQGIGIVFGANLGTTTGAWLVAGFGLIGFGLYQY